MLQKRGRGLQADTYAGTAGYHRVHQRTEIADRGPADRASAARESFLAAYRATTCCGCGGTRSARSATNRQANRDWRGRRSLVSSAPDGCGPVALARGGSKVDGPAESGGLRFSSWFACAHGSRHKAPRIVAYPVG